MPIKVLRLLGLLCSALVLGLTLIHVLQWSGSAGLSGAAWLDVQHTFYGGFAIVGGVFEVLGLVATGTLGIIYLAKSQSIAAISPLLAAGCFVGTLHAFAFGNAPVNAKGGVVDRRNTSTELGGVPGKLGGSARNFRWTIAVAFLAMAISLVWGRHADTKVIATGR